MNERGRSNFITPSPERTGNFPFPSHLEEAALDREWEEKFRNGNSLRNERMAHHHTMRIHPQEPPHFSWEEGRA